jgi:hypothetical protein
MNAVAARCSRTWPGSSAGAWMVPALTLPACSSQAAEMEPSCRSMASRVSGSVAANTRATATASPNSASSVWAADSSRSAASSAGRRIVDWLLAFMSYLLANCAVPRHTQPGAQRPVADAGKLEEELAEPAGAKAPDLGRASRALVARRVSGLRTLGSGLIWCGAAGWIIAEKIVLGQSLPLVVGSPCCVKAALFYKGFLGVRASSRQGKIMSAGSLSDRP